MFKCCANSVCLSFQNNFQHKPFPPIQSTMHYASQTFLLLLSAIFIFYFQSSIIDRHIFESHHWFSFLFKVSSKSLIILVSLSFSHFILTHFFFLFKFLSFFCLILKFSFYRHATIITFVLSIIFIFIIVRITFASARVYFVSHRSDPPRPYRLVVPEVIDDTSSIVSMLSSS